jgi:hypothetical protein
MIGLGLSITTRRGVGVADSEAPSRSATVNQTMADFEQTVSVNVVAEGVEYTPSLNFSDAKNSQYIFFFLR